MFWSDGRRGCGKCGAVLESEDPTPEPLEYPDYGPFLADGVSVMVSEREYDAPAMTEEERLAKRRFEAYFAFEMMSEQEFRQRNS